MSLKIVQPSEPLPVDNLVLTLYSAPGWGKTSLACTADKPLLLDADKGSHRASGVKAESHHQHLERCGWPDG